MNTPTPTPTPISVVACIEILVDLALYPNKDPATIRLTELIDEERVRLHVCPFQIMLVYSMVLKECRNTKTAEEVIIDHLLQQGTLIQSSTSWDELKKAMDIFGASFEKPSEEDFDFIHLADPRTLVYSHNIQVSALVTKDVTGFDHLKRCMTESEECNLAITDINGLANLCGGGIPKSEQTQSTINEQRQVTKNPSIRVFTRNRREVKKLPFGASVIDFAFALHSDIGNQCYGAIINGITKVGPDANLQDGDVVEILRKPEGYDGDLERFATTELFKRKARRRDRERYIKKGRLLIHELSTGNQKFKRKLVSQLAVEFKLLVDEFLFQVGKEEINREKLKESIDEIDRIRKGRFLVHTQNLDLDQENLQVKRASCCDPIPGNLIYGVIGSNRQSMIIHRSTCNRLHSVKPSAHITIAENLEWACNSCKADITVILQDSPDIARPILNLIHDHISDYNFRELKIENDGVGTMSLILKISSSQNIENLIDSINKLKGVKSVRINSFDDFSN